MKQSVQLNLARQWRSKTFGEIVGQRLVVDLLTAGLRKELFFPVYLLTGLRGTGKTSIGRIFATALNCRALAAFQRGEIPNEAFPCQQCDSCLAMRSGSHPDFIEIDAASHTGVDHVRQIIDEAGFLPVLGQWKVYLIDEVHMLSKAASNAFLKILEEPPASALFLLATTDHHKILETVKSRSFQLFFDPISIDDMVPHLTNICRHENIAFDEEGLVLVARRSEGALRDALNLIERVRFLPDGVSAVGVRKLCGDIDDKLVLEMLTLIGNGCSLPEFLDFWQEHALHSCRPLLLWERLVEMIRLMLWALHNRYPTNVPCDQQLIKSTAELFEVGQLLEMLDMLCRAEGQFLRSAAQKVVLERLVWSMVIKCGRDDDTRHAVRRENKPSIVRPAVQEQSAAAKSVAAENHSAAGNSQWDAFLSVVANDSSADPLVRSVLQQGECVSVGGETDVMVRVSFPKKFTLYQEQLVLRRSWWQPLFEQVFGTGALLVPDFSRVDAEREPVARRVEPASSSVASASVPTPPVQRRPFQQPQRPIARKGEAVTLGEGEEWQQARALVDLFPGTITAIKEEEQ